MKKIFMFSIVFVFGLFLSGLAIAQTTNADIIPPDVLMPGMIEGTGTHFEVADSEYFNIVLDSSESITLRLESIPEMVTMHVEPVSDASSTQITISGFQPSTKYYKYEDNYHNLNEFITDGNGGYSWTQDLRQRHLVFIQPRKSTKFIADNATGGDCYLIGTWDFATKTCTLTSDIYETIQIDSDYITLDGSGHTVTGTGTGSGVYFDRRSGVTIKNLNVKNFMVGIACIGSNNNVITANTVSNNGIGIQLSISTSSIFTNNTASNNYFGLYIIQSNNNSITDSTIEENAFSDMHVEAFSDSDCENTIQHITGSGGRPIKYFNSAVNIEGETLSQLILCNADYSNIGNMTIQGSETLKNNGILLVRTDYSNIANTLSLGNRYGFLLRYSSYNNLTGNTAQNNHFGIYSQGDSDSIFSDNNLSNNDYGFLIMDSNKNIITSNAVSSNLNGFYLYYSSNHEIYNNDFINNSRQAYVVGGSGNIFNFDAPIGGNYWSNFNAPAEGCYDTNYDGFCDSPYYFAGGVDYLPWARQSGWEMPTIEGLIILISQLLQSGGIDNAGVANSLLSKLNNALTAANTGNEEASNNMMQAFINQVSAQTGQHINQSDAAILINAATYIINN